MMRRGNFLKLSAVAAVWWRHQIVICAIARRPGAKELRIGYQKNGVLVIARQQATLERKARRLRSRGEMDRVHVRAADVEAMNVGSVDVGRWETRRRCSRRPPVLPSSMWRVSRSPMGREILVGQGSGHPRASPTSRASASGFTQGSSAHNLTVIALEKAGRTYQDIVPVYLSPPDAAAAFVRRSIDAWAIWDSVFRHRRDARRTNPGVATRSPRLTRSMSAIAIYRALSRRSARGR